MTTVFDPFRLDWQPVNYQTTSNSLYTLQDIQQSLAHSNNTCRQRVSTNTTVLAAVSMLLFDHPDGELHIVFTQRSKELKKHAGQISFPGGKKDAADSSLLHTAWRETEEEVGIPAADIQYVGQLPALDTQTGFYVTPFVGYLPFYPQHFVVNPAEVAHVFTVPLNYIIHPKHFKQVCVEIGKNKRILYAVDWQQYRIWGATAAMLRSLHLQLSEPCI